MGKKDLKFASGLIGAILGLGVGSCIIMTTPAATGSKAQIFEYQEGRRILYLSERNRADSVYIETDVGHYELLDDYLKNEYCNNHHPDYQRERSTILEIIQNKSVRPSHLNMDM